MKVLIVSDSHGKNTNLDRVLEQVSPIDMLIHLGDLEGSEDYIEAVAEWPYELVSGNNDYFTDIEREKMITIGSYRVLLTHGHRQQVYCGTDMIKEWAKEKGADIVMFGHTHMPLIENDDDIIALNPGSISKPRQEGHIPTYMIMDLDRTGVAHFTLNYLK
ncbi:metallophosphoesterase [Velocimicrobium porci]|uniref:Phosphoesterase n=1 Tax=Velocimicrobium porci TaxID=2606634 RepID=A0A6L5XW01_9FIRM|nr:metallophosphoesterase [Velocimicrobium porci]MSS62774.1 metallophosphoesterase [Velocimicrobium porci]